MLTFRQKIFISYVVVFLVFLTLMFPFSSWMVKNIIFKSMRDRAIELIARIQSAPNNEALIRRLKDQKHIIFFRVSVITDEHKSLYDSHIKRLLGPKFSQEQIIDHPEVLEAFKKGNGYHEEYSDLLGQRFAYMAQAFDFHGKTYVMRTAYPYKYVVELTQYFEIGFLILATVILLLFSLMTWFIINRLTNPIQQIISAVQPYEESENTSLPEIVLPGRSATDEISKLAETLNSLSRKVQKQIGTLTDERNEKSAILESLVEGVIAIDSNYKVLYANSTALKFLELEKEDLVGQDLRHIQDTSTLEILRRSLEEEKAVSDTLKLKNAKGQLYLDIVAAPINKQNNGAVLVMQDKTSHYRILEMRKEFIANASHELKTPITIIRGFAETLHDNPDMPQDLCVEITGKIVRNCKRMTKLIKDLLTLSDIEHIPESRLIECDMHHLVVECCEQLQDAYPDTNIQLVPEESEEFNIIADPYLMEMAVNNLIENAAKYSKGPAHIKIEFTDQGDKIQMTVADKGIGIPAQDLEHIFQRFYTVNKSHSAKLGGSGLGLSLVETIIEKHFGKISVESQVNEGTKFTIILPKIRDNYNYS
ncbi:MAG: ATP-binding protein [Parachlamydiales bacterium]|jgi:PAS domain S-box-containing protein